MVELNNLYQITSVFTLENPEISMAQPAVITYIYSHEKAYSQEEFSSMFNSLSEKYGGIIAEVDADLQQEFGFKKLNPTHIAFSGGTVLKDDLEKIAGQKF